MELLKELSVVIPMHNGMRFIDRAINSINSVSKEIEIIVVENGSSDQSFDHVSREFPDIKIISLEVPSKSMARNMGVEHATRQIVTFLDQDDELLKNRAKKEHLLGALNGHVIIGTQEFNPDEFALMPDYLQNSKNKHLPNYHPISMLIERNIFLKEGLFDPSFDLAEDMEILTRFQRRGVPVKYMAEGFVLRHFHESNESHKVAQAEREMFRMLRMNIKEKSKNN